MIRVVSLVPSLTESAISLGVTPIACTRFCEQPTLAHVGGTKNPDIDAIIALRPDLVLLDREENREQDADALSAAGLALHVTQVRAVSDVSPMLADLAAALGVGVGAKPPALQALGDSSTAAFVPIWRRPWMTISAATYGSSLLSAIGVANVFADHPDAYPTVTLDVVRERSPQLVLLPSEPYSFTSRHEDELRDVLPGVEIRSIDGQDLFWWGTRTHAAIGRLRASIGQIDGPSSP
ncbi:MAG: helical backbone metal receptor [Ilumatobacteraceae bacterium]